MSNRARRSLALLGVVPMLLLGVGCTSDSEEPEPSSAAAEEIPLKVMAFNIEYGGDVVDFDSVSKAIEAADADVVAIQEGYAKMPDIAADLGWDYYDARTQVVSKFPLINPSDQSSGEVYVQVEPGKVVAMLGVHLPSTKFGPNRAAAGETAEELVAGEAHRVRAVEPVLATATSLMQQDIPVFVLGDFNSPSHLDWTEEAIGVREHVTDVVAWPTSIAVEEAGLTDMYRSVYPDPVEMEGLTWPAARPRAGSYNPALKGKPADRIDQMYSGGAIITNEIAIVGEESSPVTDIAVSPWPSDHRGIVATTEVVPGDLGTLVSVGQRLVEQPEDIEVFYNAVDDNAATLTISSQDGGTTQTEDVDDASAGEQAFSTDQLDPGTYDIVLATSDGAELARTVVWVVEEGAEPVVTTDKPKYEAGEAVEVSWAGAPGNKWDWIGIYKQGADPNVAYYLMWQYTEATIEGSVTFDDAINQWPLKPGKYSAYLMADDSYVKLGGGDFEVTG